VCRETEKILILVSISVTPENPLMRNNAEYEKKCYYKSYGILDNLTNAIAWVHTIIKKNNYFRRTKNRLLF